MAASLDIRWHVVALCAGLGYARQLDATLVALAEGEHAGAGGRRSNLDRNGGRLEGDFTQVAFEGDGAATCACGAGGGHNPPPLPPSTWTLVWTIDKILCKTYMLLLLEVFILCLVCLFYKQYVIRHLTRFRETVSCLIYNAKC